MDWNVLDEYLVRIGADIDRQSFDSAIGALGKLKGALSKLKYAAAPLALAGAIGAIGKAAYETVKGVAQADMEYQKLAASMWVTKETAKSLSVAMKTMGVSQEDLAWVPELREQFFRLREEINKFATPEDADAQLRYIREIGYDVQTLFVRLKMLKEWIAYYLIKYLEPYIKDFKAFINWLLDKLGEDLPGIARKVARAMSTVLSPALATIKLLGMAIGKVYDFIVSLPDNVKKWAAIFAAVGAAIMAGPFGLIIAGLSMAMILLEDFLGYMNGWDSSADLAPLWEALLKFQEGTGAEWLEKFRDVLADIADILDHIVTELKIEELFNSIKDAVVEITKGTIMLWEANLKGIEDLLKLFKVGKNDVKSFFTAMVDEIVTGIKNLSEFAKLFGKLLQTIALLQQGEVRKAWDLFKDSVVEFGENVGNNTAELQKRRNSRRASIIERAIEAGRTLGGRILGDQISNDEGEAEAEPERPRWSTLDRVKRFFGKRTDDGASHGGGGGDAVVDNASQFESGYKWMDPTGANTDPRNQCASFASQMMAGSGVDVDVTMNGNDLAAQFKREGAYHPAGDDYEPQPGDLIDWAHHVGIYAGNGEYIARNSSGGVVRGSMSGMEKYFGELWGFGSVAELQAAKHKDDGVSNQNDYALAQQVTGSQQDISDVPTEAGFVSGSNDMAMEPFKGILDGFKNPQINIPDIQIPMPEMPSMPEIPAMAYAQDMTRDNPQYLPQPEVANNSTSYAMNMGAPVININVAGTNATPKDIAGAVQDGIANLGDYLLNIQARNMRRPVV